MSNDSQEIGLALRNAFAEVVSLGKQGLHFLWNGCKWIIIERLVLSDYINFSSCHNIPNLAHKGTLNN